MFFRCFTVLADRVSPSEFSHVQSLASLHKANVLETIDAHVHERFLTVPLGFFVAMTIRCSGRMVTIGHERRGFSVSKILYRLPLQKGKIQKKGL